MAATKADIEKCGSLLEEEFQVLESIFPDYLSNQEKFTTDRILKLEIPVELGGDDGRIVVLDSDPEDKASAASSGAAVDYSRPVRLSLSDLPPLLLSLHLPVNYPIHAPPFIVSIHPTYSWIPIRFLKTLENDLLSVWETERTNGEGRGILYDWVEMIRSAEFLNELGLMASGIIRIPHPAPVLFGSQLSNFDKNVRFTKFSQTMYPCGICLTSVKGSRCIRLQPCEHVFCKPCLTDFWQLLITEGDVGRVGCPDPKCVKEGTLAEEEDVRRVVGTEEEVRRWKWLKEKKEMERDPTITHCPLSFCQKPVRKPVVEEGSGWEKLRSCTACGYSFCSFCRRTWHGPHTHCVMAAAQAFVEEYIALAEDSPRRLVLEKQYGRVATMKLVKQYEEDLANKKFLDSCATSCPGCAVYVEKSYGCNHMTCARCQMHFCYLCGQKLKGTDPYIHYSHKGQRCYQRLFDDARAEGDEDWWEEI